MKTTLKKIRSFDPCKDGWKKLLKTLGTDDLDTEVSLLQILDSNGVKDAYWVLRCWNYKEYCVLLADVAESVLPIFEAEYPEDKRPRLAIEAVRKYASGGISEEELKAVYDAADAAVYDAARSAANTAARSAGYAEKKQWGKNEQLMREFIGG